MSNTSLKTDNQEQFIYESNPTEFMVLGNIKIAVTNRMLITVSRERATTEIKIPIKIANHIKKNLQQFEKKQEFLNPDLKLVTLAQQFDTNTKYLAKIILTEKGKKFRDYIKDLKVGYAKSRLETDRKFRRYKITVIAAESGFKTAESFSKHFLKTYGSYPSKYIKKLGINPV